MAAPLEVTSGKHAVRAIIQARPQAIRRIALLAGARRYLEEFERASESLGIAPEILPRGRFLRVGNLSQDDKHQGVFVLAEPRALLGERDLNTIDEGVVVALDQVSNPRNLGTILRGAAYFGVEAVLMMKDRSAILGPDAVRVAVGAADLVRIHRVTNLARSLAILKDSGFWVYGLDASATENVFEVSWPDRTILVMGNETKGLSPLVIKSCDAMASIPLAYGLDSLNVSVAAGIALFQVAFSPSQ